MSRQVMMAFAVQWIASWNRRDVDAVLAHFAPEATFVSPVAARYLGHGVIQGRDQLAGYWRAALARIKTLEFTLDRAAWDEEARELTVIYEANIDGSRMRACEIMSFDPEGRQVRGEALYGAAL